MHGKVHLPAYELFDTGACTGANFLHELALFAQHDGLVGLLVHMEHDLDARNAQAFVERLHLDRDSVRDLVARVLQHLLAHVLGHEKANRFVRDFVFRVEKLAFGQERPDLGQDAGSAIHLARRQRNDGREVTNLRQTLEHREEDALVFDAVHLVQDEDDFFSLGHPLEDGEILARHLRGRRLAELAEKNDDVSVAGGFFGHRVHSGPELGPSGVDTGRVQEDELLGIVG